MINTPANLQHDSGTKSIKKEILASELKEEDHETKRPNQENSPHSKNNYPSSTETQDKKNKKSNSTVTSISSDEFLEIQSKDINANTKILCKFFYRNKYPSKKELNELATKTNKTLTSIETWFKNRRRSLANRGLMPHYMRKKIFKPHEVKILKKFFKKTQEPNQRSLEQIATRLNSTVKHIRNWFAYHKKKIDFEKEESSNSNSNNDDQNHIHGNNSSKTSQNDSNNNNSNNIKSLFPLSSAESSLCPNQTTTSPNTDNQQQHQPEMNHKHFPQKKNFYSISSISKNENQMGPNFYLHQPNQMTPITLNQNNFTSPSNQNSFSYYQNNNNNEGKFYILTQMPNPVPYNNVILIQNPHQNPHQNQYLMPMLKPENLGYVLVQNVNPNINSNVKNYVDFRSVPNYYQYSSETNSNFYTNGQENNQNPNFYLGYVNGNMYPPEFKRSGHK